MCPKEGPPIDGRRGRSVHGTRSGQVIILFVGALLLLAAICVFTVDVGRLFACRSQLQNAVDAAALAAASQLTGYISEQERVIARQEAKALAAANLVDSVPLHLTDDDIEFGHYEHDTGIFTPVPETSVVDSVRVTGRRSADSPDGPIDLVFGPLFGWDQMEFQNVVATGTKPRRFVMFVLDRSGSMCFDTSGVNLAPTAISRDSQGYFMHNSPSGWYWFPELALKRAGQGWSEQTAWFYARDNGTGEVRTDFLPDHIKSRLDSGTYFNFRPRDYPTLVMSGWIKVPSGVTIYGRYRAPWKSWLADDYYHVIWDTCGYARTSGAVQPLQSTMDAACAFVDLLNNEDDRAGSVTYGWLASMDQTLTSDFATLKTKLQTFVPCGATAEPEGMEAANDELIDSGRVEAYGEKIMILLTDGYANMLNEVQYADAQTYTYDFLGESVTTKIHPTVGAAMAQQTTRAKLAGVRIYAVSFGTDVDQAVHRRIAAETNGTYYYSADHADLPAIFIDIFRRLPSIITQ